MPKPTTSPEKRKPVFSILPALIGLALLAGCAAPAFNPTATPSLTASTSPLAGDDGGLCVIGTPCAEPTPGDTATATLPPTQTPTPGPTHTATPDLRLDPANWQNWPIVPERVSALARETYARGLAAGNDPRHFSKIGDCQAIREVLMGLYDKPLQYNVSDKPYLQDTIDQFAGSFDRDGQGVKGGFNAAAVLSPIWADPAACQPGETPMECEWRTWRPSIVIISLEVWWDGRTPERYEDYMRRLIDYYLEKGVVPILSTKADNVEGNHAINYATARLAYEYDLPLWNWWRMAQMLPNGGLDPARPDGFHISYEAWTPRGRTALESLDAVWKLLNAEPVSVTDTPAPAATATPTLAPIEANFMGFVETVELPKASAGQPGVLFSVSERDGEAERVRGLYRLALDGHAPELLLNNGIRLQDVSPVGDAVLASRGSDLYLILGKDWIGVNDFQVDGEQTAAFLPGGDGFAYLAERPGEGVTVNLQYSKQEAVKLDRNDHVPQRLAAVTPNGVFWTADGLLWRSPLDGSPAVQVAAIPNPLVSPDGRWVAYTADNGAGTELFFVLNVENGVAQSVYLEGSAWSDIVWSPDGSSLAVLRARRSDYSGKVFGYNLWLVDPATLTARTQTALEGLNPRLAFSADNQYLYRAATWQQEDGSYTIHLDRLKLGESQVEAFDTALSSSDFLWATLYQVQE
jgi:hypothetical protein